MDRLPVDCRQLIYGRLSLPQLIELSWTCKWVSRDTAKYYRCPSSIQRYRQERLDADLLATALFGLKPDDIVVYGNHGGIVLRLSGDHGKVSPERTAGLAEFYRNHSAVVDRIHISISSDTEAYVVDTHGLYLADMLTYRRLLWTHLPRSVLSESLVMSIIVRDWTSINIGQTIWTMHHNMYTGKLTLIIMKGKKVMPQEALR